ncbi:MAG: leucine-rich repeat domain-containing protein [Maricaulaceae bacterium]
MKPSWIRRARPVMLPILLAGWVAAAGVGLALAPNLQKEAARAALSSMGLAVAENGTYIATFASSWCTDSAMRSLPDILHALNLNGVLEIDLSFTRVTNLAPLGNLSKLRILWLSDTKIENLAGLQALTALETLDLSRTKVTNLAPLKALTTLETLLLVETDVQDLSPLQDLTNLQLLILNETHVADLTPVRHVPHIAGATAEAYATIGRDERGRPIKD